MARTIFLPKDVNSPPGSQSNQTPGMWLTNEMEARTLTNIKLFDQMRLHGFHAISPNVISMWRADSVAISLKTLPLLLLGLGMSMREQRSWIRHFVAAELPTLWPYLEEVA